MAGKQDASAASLVLASGNPGKLAELRGLLSGSGIKPGSGIQPGSRIELGSIIKIVTQDQLGVQEVPETGKTFIENALLKARNCAVQSDLAALADDSGLVVEALGGSPGIFSARYAGVGANDRTNNELLLKNMQGMPPSQRSAYFYCVLVLLRHPDDPAPIVTQGLWPGSIALELQGAGGFGYDPLFIPAGEERSAAEMSMEEKGRHSHRGRALRALAAELKQRAL